MCGKTSTFPVGQGQRWERRRASRHGHTKFLVFHRISPRAASRCLWARRTRAERGLAFTSLFCRACSLAGYQTNRRRPRTFLSFELHPVSIANYLKEVLPRLPPPMWGWVLPVALLVTSPVPVVGSASIGGFVGSRCHRCCVCHLRRGHGSRLRRWPQDRTAAAMDRSRR